MAGAGVKAVKWLKLGLFASQLACFAAVFFHVIQVINALSYRGMLSVRSLSGMTERIAYEVPLNANALLCTRGADSMIPNWGAAHLPTPPFRYTCRTIVFGRDSLVGDCRDRDP